MLTTRSDVRLNYWVEGADDAPPLLLLAPLGRSGELWRAQLPTLSRSFRCLLMDTRGTGQSDDAPTYSIEEFADDALAVIDELGVEVVHVAGWSMGAATAMQFALRAPHRTATLSLYTPWARANRSAQGWFEVLRDQTSGLDDLSVAELTTTLLLLSNAAIDAFEDLGEAMRATVTDPGYPSREAMLGHLDAAIAHDVLDELPQVCCPTLVVAGDEDRWVDASLSRAVADAIPNADFILLQGPGATHGLPYERTEEFNEIAVNWLLQHK